MGVVVKRVIYKVGDNAVFLESEAPASREMAQYTPAQPAQIVAQGSAASARGAIKLDGNGNWPDLCPKEGFLTKSFCQSQQCKADPSLAGHPICVDIKKKNEVFSIFCKKRTFS